MGYAHVEESRRGGNRFDLPPHSTDITEAIDSTIDLGSVTWLHTVSSKLDYRLTAAFATNDRDTYYGAGMDPNAYGSTSNPLFTLDSQVNSRLGKHYLSAGVQVQHDKLTDRQPVYDRQIEETYTNLGLFVQDDWILGEDWELIIGSRWDDFSEIDSAIVSPRGALRWSPRADLTARLSVATGFRGPRVFDEDLHITQVGGEGQVIHNDPNLEEESSMSASLDMELTPTLAGGVGLLEAERDESDPDFGSVRYFRIPDRYGVLSIMAKIPWDVELWAGFKVTGSMEVPHYAGYIDEDRLEATESFLTVDARIARSFVLFNEPTTRSRIAAGGRNLTDEYQQDLDQGRDRDAGYVYEPRVPRSWYVSLGLVFEEVPVLILWRKQRRCRGTTYSSPATRDQPEVPPDSKSSTKIGSAATASALMQKLAVGSSIQRSCQTPPSR